MAQQLIAEKDTPHETFALLGQLFNLDARVVVALLAETIVALRDFRFFFATEAEADTFVSKQDPVIPHAQLQISRLRGAWTAVRNQAARQDGDRSRIELAGLEEMLTPDELNNVKTRFWKRHKLHNPPETMPADSLISRCSKELTKRMLDVVPVSTVKTLMHQVTHSKKRR